MKKRDGGSKDNDSYMSRVMCLISLRNWRNERGGGGGGHSQLRSATRSTKILHLTQQQLITARPFLSVSDK